MESGRVGEATAPVENAERLWMLCAEALRDQVNEATWKTWFEGIRASWADDEQVVLSVPSSLVKERLESRYLTLVGDVLADATGKKLVIRIVVDTDAGHEQQHLHAPAVAARPESKPTAPETGKRRWDDGSSGAADQAAVEGDYTFDAFVTGPSNRFAHAAALAVAETPGKSYNPLYIHGGVGLGKTHLLHAIGNYVRDNFRGRVVRYVPSETFLNEFVDAIRTNTTPAFKRRYRECHLLLVDDVQFMEGKEGLQEEFFHTFNELHQTSRQIVITSDRPPNSFTTLDDRLRSRFMSGLTATVQPPDLETRLAILRSKAGEEAASRYSDVLEYIATNVKDNIRQLEGALTQVLAHASVYGQHLTVELAEEVLFDLFGTNQPRPITPKVILDATASLFGFAVEDLCGTSRRRPLVTARQISMYVFRHVTDYSYPAIAREFGGRDHTTVIHAVEKISTLMKEKRQIYDQVNELMARISSGG
ncbi:MAG TPA: chromosomal replication initiator protein DnaA [Acidimicrobiales bacterium]|nr:chromosomal replication initiator protein DnaA [Acidimicrobiales bacterium]